MAVSKDSSGREWLCLNFVNSVDLRLSVRDEALNSYGDVVTWSCQQGVVTGDEADSLLEKAASHPKEAASVFERVIALREALYRILSATVHGRRVPETDVKLLNETLVDESAPVQLVYAEGGLTEMWLDRRGELGWMLAPVTRSATALLRSGALHRMRECPGSPGKACGWLFMDTTKNGSRQWCVGGMCGNRARVHRHFSRKKAPHGG